MHKVYSRALKVPYCMACAGSNQHVIRSLRAAPLQGPIAVYSKALKALQSARDQITACTKALKAAERQLSELELAAPKLAAPQVGAHLRLRQDGRQVQGFSPQLALLSACQARAHILKWLKWRRCLDKKTLTQARRLRQRPSGANNWNANECVQAEMEATPFQ
eukprot:1161635-Pelagomonas_calceolata.AAC.19